MSAPAFEIELAYRRCEQITRSEAANFYYGIRLLPRFKRQAMCAVYAFARRVDDIGDDEGEPEQQLAALAAERAMLATLGDPHGNLEDPVRVALEHSRQHYALPIDALELLVEGVEMDVRGTSFETFDDLVGYCRRVAGAVGRLCLAIFADGEVSEQADALADDLGVAMQITNILRDIREDETLGRTYLPLEDLREFGFDGPPAAGAPGAEDLIRCEAERAAQWFDRGLGLIPHLDSRSASCVLAMTGIYRSILDRILADPGQVLVGRISLSPWEKGWVALHSLVSARLHGTPIRSAAV